MRLKCDDGVVREFSPCAKEWTRGDIGESSCNECGLGFGFHDTHILKPLWRKHICKDECHNCGKSPLVKSNPINNEVNNCKNCGAFAGFVR